MVRQRGERSSSFVNGSRAPTPTGVRAAPSPRSTLRVRRARARARRLCPIPTSRARLPRRDALRAECATMRRIRRNRRARGGARRGGDRPLGRGGEAACRAAGRARGGGEGEAAARGVSPQGARRGRSTQPEARLVRGGASSRRSAPPPKSCATQLHAALRAERRGAVAAAAAARRAQRRCRTSCAASGRRPRRRRPGGDGGGDAAGTIMQLIFVAETQAMGAHRRFVARRGMAIGGQLAACEASHAHDRHTIGQTRAARVRLPAIANYPTSATPFGSRARPSARCVRTWRLVCTSCEGAGGTCSAADAARRDHRRASSVGRAARAHASVAWRRSSRARGTRVLVARCRRRTPRWLSDERFSRAIHRSYLSQLIDARLRRRPRRPPALPARTRTALRKLPPPPPPAAQPTRGTHAARLTPASPLDSSSLVPIAEPPPTPNPNPHTARFVARSAPRLDGPLASVRAELLLGEDARHDQGRRRRRRSRRRSRRHSRAGVAVARNSLERERERLSIA